MRLFIAIPLSEEMKKALVTCMHDLKKQGVEGNYVPAQNLHLTLAFIGEYDDPEKVKEVLRSVPMPPFRMSLSEKGNFGNLLWAGVKGNQKLNTFAKGRDDGEACGADEVGAKERESKLSGDVNRSVVQRGDGNERRDFPVCEKEI